MTPDTMLSGAARYHANSRIDRMQCIRRHAMSTIQVRTAWAVRRSRGRQARSWSGAAGRTIDLLLIWQQRARDRRQLESLSDHMLRDIGLSRADVFAEASKPFWRP
jgi:uncharacterized protein YjiS (DUF1127 family)